MAAGRGGARAVEETAPILRRTAESRIGIYDNVRAFPGTMAKHGAMFQIQRVWRWQGVRAYTAWSWKLLKEEGDVGYLEQIQKPPTGWRPSREQHDQWPMPF